MAPSQTPDLPSVDFLGQTLAVHDRVAFISSTPSIDGSHCLVTGHILVIHRGELCIESGILATIRGAVAKGPDRYHHNTVYRLPRDDQDDARIRAQERVDRVLALPDGPEVEDPSHPWSGQYRLGYLHGVAAAKRAVENPPATIDQEQP